MAMSSEESNRRSGAVLRLEGVTVGYAGQSPLVCGWSVGLPPGVSLLYGDEGSGKSTLLRVIAGSMASEGSKAVAGVAFDVDPAAYRRNVFFCDPASCEFDAMKVVECRAALSAGDASFRPGEWSALAEGFSLTPHLDKSMYMLSTGSRRKVYLASALASGRPLVLLDEPTAALDAPSIACLHDALRRLAGDAARAAAGARAVLVASARRLDGIALSTTVDLPTRCG